MLVLLNQNVGCIKSKYVFIEALTIPSFCRLDCFGGVCNFNEYCLVIKTVTFNQQTQL